MSLFYYRPTWSIGLLQNIYPERFHDDECLRSGRVAKPEINDGRHGIFSGKFTAAENGKNFRPTNIFKFPVK